MKKCSFDLLTRNKNGKTKALFFSTLICISSFFMTGLTADADGGAKYEDYNVPRVYIETLDGNGNSLKKIDGYADAQIKVVGTDGTTIADEGQIKVRGNTTSLGEKKPYTIKFANKQNVFGMGEAKKWALLANSFDPTLIRNCVAFEIADELGLAYTPDHEFVEVYLDDVFKGCYELTEPIEAKTGRVDITTKKNKDFLIQYESTRTDTDAVYITPGDIRFEIKEPEEPSEAQTEYITDTMSNIIDVIKTRDIEQIKNYIDLDSFAAYYLLNDFYKTVDFSYSSVYYYYKDGILYAGPTWDFDLSSGNTYADNAKKLSPLGQDANVQLYSQLCRCPEFMCKVRETYIEHYDYFKNIYADGGLADQLVKENAALFARNYSDAGWVVSKSYSPLMRKPDATYAENVKYFKNWLSERNDWLTEYYCVSDGSNTKNFLSNLSSIPYVYYEAGPGKVTVKWSSVSCAQKYCVVGLVNGRWQSLGEGYGNVFELNDLTGGKEYKIAVLVMIDGRWKSDFSNAITVVPNDANTIYPNITDVQYNKEFHQFKLTWSPVKKADMYAIAVKIAGRYKVLATTDTTSFISPKLKAGDSYNLVVCAKINGKWDLSKINSREVTIRVQ